MGDRVDLDDVQGRYNHGTIASDPAVILTSMHDVPALVAELRDTRQVVDAARGLLDILASPDPHFGWVKRQHAALADAVATHDRNAQMAEHDQAGSGG